MKKRDWVLIDNDAQTTRRFSSYKKLRQYAQKYGMEIKKSPMSDRSYYTIAVAYVPLGARPTEA